MTESKTLSVTDAIYQELVDGLKTGLDWPHFLVKHGASKGPLYNAIGRFFSDMEPKVRALNEVQREVDEAGLRLAFLDQKIKQAEDSLARLEERGKALKEQNETLEAKCAGKGELIKQAGELEKLGFDIGRLRELREALTEIGAKHGLKGKEAVSKFFVELKDYDVVLGAGLQLKGLQAQIDTKRSEVERWQAEARAAEAKCKARKTGIDITEKLLAQGVRESDLPHWARILAKAGVSPEGLAQDLEQYSSLEAVVQARQKRADELKGEVGILQSQVKALTQERDEIHAAITAVRDKGLAEIERMSQMTLANQGTLMDKAGEYAKIAHQAGALTEEVALARAFRSQEPEQWKQVSRRVVQELLGGLVMWSQADASHNPFMPSPPRSLSSSLYFYVSGSAQLEDILLWALRSVFTEAERRALADGR